MGADPLTRKSRPWERLTASLFAPVDGSSLAVFRIMFGALVVLEAVRYLLRGWITEHFVRPPFHFTYYGFEWVRPLPSAALHDFFIGMLVVGGLLALGLFFRIAAVLAFLSISYLFLMDQALYLNHIYLFALVALLLCFTDAHRAASLDRLWFRWQGPALIPAWQLHLIRAQVFLVYFFGGIAKLNSDWLRAEPVRTWMHRRADLPLLGPIVSQEWAIWLITYGGLVFDLGVGFLLLWRRTRLLALLLAFGFHTANNFLFRIGIFPYMAFALTLLFLEPDWPVRARDFLQRLVARFYTPSSNEPESLDWDDEEDLPAAPPAPRPEPAPAAQKPAQPEEPSPRWRPPSPSYRRWVLAGLGAYLTVQVLLPLRHWLYPGDVNWTEEGHRFSWRMKLRDKQGSFTARVRDPATGREWTVKPEQHLAEWQMTETAGRPDMLLQYAHFVRDEFRDKQGIAEPEVYLLSRCRLNDHPEQELINPAVNLARRERRLWPHADWIVHRRQ